MPSFLASISYLKLKQLVGIVQGHSRTSKRNNLLPKILEQRSIGSKTTNIAKGFFRSLPICHHTFWDHFSRGCILRFCRVFGRVLRWSNSTKRADGSGHVIRRSQSAETPMTCSFMSERPKPELTLLLKLYHDRSQ